MARALAIVALLAALGPAAVADERYLYIQPLGRELPDEDVALVVRGLEAVWGAKVKTLPRMELPKSAFYPPRRRYRADRLLEVLAPRLPPDGDKILGLTAVDISTTKGKVYDWGVLGLGDLDGRACVISKFRAVRGALSAAQARERLAKVAVHEIGHTRGLDHCPTVGCLMEDAEGKVATTDREYDLCDRCRRKLVELGRPAPAHPTLPWPRPQTP